MNLISAAQTYQTNLHTLQRSPLYRQFKTEKRELKNLINQYIDAGGSKDNLIGKTVVCLNTIGEDRISKKIKKSFIKHKYRRNPSTLEPLMHLIQEVSLKLFNTYKKIDQATWVIFNPLWRPLWMSTHKDVIINYPEFLSSKKALGEILKKVTFKELEGMRKQLTAARIDSKTINIIKRITIKNALENKE